MTNPELTTALAGLTGQVAHLSIEVGRLADGQVSPAALLRLESGQTRLQTDVSQLTTGVAELKRDMVAVKTDVAELKTDVTELKRDMVAVRADVAELKTDVAGLKRDMVEVKADVAELKTGQEELRSCVLRLQLSTESQGEQLRLVAEGHGVLLAEIARLRTDTEAGFRDARDFMVAIHKDLCGRMDGLSRSGLPPA